MMHPFVLQMLMSLCIRLPFRKNNKIITYCRQQHMNLLKRSDILQIISKGTFNICIAGTHGKTTTSTMVAHVLRNTGFGCNAFLGGISTNYHTIFLE